MGGEQHEATAPVDYPAYHQARSRCFRLLSMWLMDEREKCEPSSDRWKALADVSEKMRRLEDQEVGPVSR